MKLTMDIIIYVLQDLCPVWENRRETSNYVAGARFLYVNDQGGIEASPYEDNQNYLYISTLSNVWEWKEHLKKDMAILATKDISLSKADLQRIPGDLVLVEGTYQLPYLLNRAYGLFEKFVDWDKRMHIASLEGKTLQEMVEYSEELIRHPMVIFDSSFDVLAHTNHNLEEYPNFRDTVLLGYTDAKTMSQIKEQEIFQKLKKEYILIAPAATEPDKKNIYIRFDGNQETLGYAAIYVADDAVSQGYMDIVAILTDNLNLCFRRDFEQERYGRMMYESFLSNLLQGSNMTIQQVEDQIANIGSLQRTGIMSLGVVRFLDEANLPYSFLARYLAREMEDVRIFIYQEQICMLRYYSDYDLSQLTDWEENNLQILLSNYNYVFGISNVFSDILDLKYAYQQATFGVEMAISQKQQVGTYSDYLYQDLFRRISETMPVHMLYAKEFLLLKNHDQSSKSKYLQIVMTYLECDCNATHTADKLFLHRNTIRKVVQDVEEGLHIDLTDVQVKEMLVLSHHMEGVLKEGMQTIC